MNDSDPSSDALIREGELHQRLALDRSGRSFLPVAGSHWGELIRPAPEEKSTAPAAGLRVVLCANWPPAVRRSAGSGGLGPGLPPAGPVSPFRVSARPSRPLARQRRVGYRQPEPGVTPPGATWPRHHVRLGLGPGTPAERIRAGLEQVDAFVADHRAGRVVV